MKQNITIIGGTDGFGKWLALFLLKSFGGDVSITVTGRDEVKGKAMSRESGVYFSTEIISAISTADITVFSVPIAYMEETIKEYAPYVKSGSIILDVCSVKDFSSQALHKYSPEGVLVIPTHPMFGPFIQSIAGQVFVLTPEEDVKLDYRYVYLKKYLEESGARVLETNACEHDRMMAVIQGLTHYNFFVFGETIRRLGVDIEKSLNFVSPIYKLMISSVERYIYQDAKLYSDIQIYNKENLKVHDIFIEVSKEFNKIVHNEDGDAFIKTVDGTKEYFGENAQKGQIYTDKIIMLLSHQIDHIKQNIGKKLQFKNIYSGEVIKKIVVGIESETIYLKNYDDLILDKWIVV